MALFRLVRFWSRRWVTTPPDRVTVEMARVRDIMVLEAADDARSATLTPTKTVWTCWPTNRNCFEPPMLAASD